MTTGIYKIENLINHKVYIGQSVHIERRWKEHCQYSTKSVISDAIKKYGKENFSFQILEECSLDELNDKEIYYIQKFNCITPNGYNVKDYVEGKEVNFISYGKDIFLNIVKDIKDNLLSFQEISKKYNISIRAVYYINKGEIHYLEEEKYPLREVEDFSKKHYYCIDCGKEIFKGSTRCKECYAKTLRTIERPNREELKKMIRNLPFTEIGKIYNVSDNAIRKWCKSENLPSKKNVIKAYSDEDWDKV